MFKAALAAGALLWPASVVAQTAAGPYLSGDVGAGLFSGSLRSIQAFTKVELDTAPAGSAALGWQFGNGLRTELQGNFQSNSVSDILTFRGNGLQPLSNVGGNLQNYSIMANTLYNIPMRWSAPLKPYVGVGAGYSWLKFSSVGGNGFGTLDLPQGNTYTGPTVVSFGTAGAFAYQALAGVMLPIRTVPGLSLTAQYQYLGTVRADVPVSRFATGGILVNGSTPSAFTHNGFVTGDNIFSVGLKYDFGVR